MAGRPAAAHGRMGGFSRVSETLSSAVASTRGPLRQTNALALAGCELSGHTRSFTFKVEEEDDTEHVLGLNMLCLTEGAKDECNVVEVVARDHDNQEIAVPVANLRLSCQPMLSLDDFQLQPPVTFRLKSGSGPVRITGRHRIVCINNDFSEEEDSEEEEIKLCGILPAKKRGGRS
ncbi:Nucleoplasmin-3 [Microtus ochrogaster]|uniref:Nucleoplasmin-3 n=1 Tax=Microtus ochrogaster TaxID=79684 RepID=A0A8J6G4T4_MICOH|nr:Nucleoplasmin-3 [Microtus ochrogaster]